MLPKKKNKAGLELVSEVYAGNPYDYYPMGEYVVAARGVCGGRPTLKYTRMDARWVMMYLENGRSPEELAATHGVLVEAIREVVALSSIYDYEKSYA